MKVDSMRAIVFSIVFFVALQFGGTAPAFHFPLALEAMALLFLGWVLLALSHSVPKTELSRFQSVAVWGVLGLVVLQLLRGIAAYVQLPTGPVCGAMPGFIQKLECVFQMEVAAIPGPRQLSYSVAAALLFLGSLLGSRTQPQLMKRILMGGLLVATALAIVTLFRYFGLIDVKLPDWFFVNEFGSACLFIQNPSWIWPWCTPWAAFAFWQATSSSHSAFGRVMFALSGLAVTLYGVISSQRGAVLQVLVACGVVFASVFIFRAIRGSVKKSQFVVVGGSAVLFSTSLVSVYFLFPEAIHQGLSSLGIHTRVGAGQSSLSHERLEMWKLAWSGIKEHFFFGHGQGSWTREFGLIANPVGRADLIFDTAHNFFVQSLFELGFIHTTLIVAFFCYLLVLLWKEFASTQSIPKRAWLSGTLAAYLVILLVQEVDFIRSSYYQHAIFWGFVFGQCALPIESQKGDDKWFAAIVSRYVTPQAVRSFSYGLLAVSSALFLLSLFSFSLIGYQYEANANNEYSPKVRWLGSFGTLNYVLPRADQRKPVARFNVLQAHASEYSVWTREGWLSVPIPKSPEGAMYIDVPVTVGLGLPQVVKFNVAVNNFGRHISVLVAWPPQIIEGDTQ